VTGLTVELGRDRIIDNLSFEVRKGEILTIMGPNGSGKTILLKTLLGFLPYNGKIEWQKGVKIGYLPQGLTPLKVRGLPISVKEFFGLKGNPEKEIKKAFRLVGIKDAPFLKKRIGDLSGGQFQKMLIAWALISKPDLLLFDEPMAGIDVSGEKTIYSFLYHIWKNREVTFLLVTHDLNIVYRYSNRVLCLGKKGFSCSGPTREVLSPKALEKLYGTRIKFYKHIHKS